VSIASGAARADHRELLAYATTLWSYINRSQPFDAPGSLTAEQVYAVTAYVLYLNGIVGENEVLDARTLPQVKMPNRFGFVPDARPDVGGRRRPRNASRDGPGEDSRRSRRPGIALTSPA
jgi:hypothetical protein